MIKRGLILALCIVMLLPAIAMAENIVEVLPTTPPMPELVLEANPYAYENLSAYYEGMYEYKAPSLTASERSRLPEVQRRWDAGERPESSILNLTENVHVTLIQVPEEQYEGESWFLLLPARELTDGEFLQLIDAYEQLGITLSADMITWHNTMRGDGNGIALRGMRDDERQRYSSISEQFLRAGLRPDMPFTDSVMDDGLGHVTLDGEDYCGMTEYTFYPARRMTDEELLRICAANNEEPAASPEEMADYESKLRRELHDQLGMPLSAQRSGEEKVQSVNISSADGDSRMSYNTSFTEADDSGRTWRGSLDIQTGKLISASTPHKENAYVPCQHTLIKHDRTEATYTEGIIEAYWECTSCGALFSDENGMNQIESPEIKEIVEVPLEEIGAATPQEEKADVPCQHTLIKHDRTEATYTEGIIEAYWECTSCGALFSDGNGMNKIESPEIKEIVEVPLEEIGAATPQEEKADVP